jgi:hypothetical protein
MDGWAKERMECWTDRRVERQFGKRKTSFCLVLEDDLEQVAQIVPKI